MRNKYTCTRTRVNKNEPPLQQPKNEERRTEVLLLHILVQEGEGHRDTHTHTNVCVQTHTQDRAPNVK